jgi:hypothetical protein
MMANFICETCGTQFGETELPPESCPICLDERQFVGHEGQRWTTLAVLRQGHRNRVEELEPGLVGIGSEPDFAIAQRALLVWTGGGNLLWDCISLLDEETVAAVNRLGGIQAIAISHPHFYSSMIEWARAFDARVLLHRADGEHVMRPDPAIEFWEGDTRELFGGLTLIRGGGHFDGGTMLHWPAGSGGRGALLSGDIIQVVSDRRWVSFMYSYPNLIPLSPSKVREVVAAVEPFEFERVYGAWWERVVQSDGKAAVRRSAERYIQHLDERD